MFTPERSFIYIQKKNHSVSFSASLLRHLSPRPPIVISRGDGIERSASASLCLTIADRDSVVCLWFLFFSLLLLLLLLLLQLLPLVINIVYNVSPASEFRPVVQ